MARYRYLPLILIPGITVAAILLMQIVAHGGPSDRGTSSLLAVLTLPLPLLLSVMWGWAWLMLRPQRLVLVLGAGALVFGALLQPGPISWQAVCNMGAGLLAGWALQRKLRLDFAVALCALVLVPMVILAIKDVPVDEQLGLLRQDMTKVLEAGIPATASKDQRALALANEQHRVDLALAAAQKIYPTMIVLGLLAQGGVILALVWFFVRLAGGVSGGRRFGSFARFRVPYYVVWLLIVGVGLFLTRTEPMATVGLNLALLACLVLSVHGFAVQIAVVGRLLSPLGRFVFWMVMGVFFAPLVIVSGVFLGLADQWLDFRGLDRPVVDEDEKVV